MNISIFSDSHCGFDYGGERQEDSFLALEEALEKGLDSDLILIAGDLFDSRIPKQDIFARVAKTLSKAQYTPSNTKLLEVIGKDKKEVSPLALRGIPVVMINGNHERRSAQVINPIQALEHAGLVVRLHCSTTIFEASGEKVAIHGMSSVPERYAKEVFKNWNPKPIEGAKNILMIHQSIDPYTYSPIEPPSLRVEDLPKGFDLYVLGHFHWHDIKELHRGRILVLGGTIPTSLDRKEAGAEKYVFKYDGKEIQKVALKSQRKVYYRELRYSKNIEKEIEDEIRDISSKPHHLRPIISIKISGRIDRGEKAPNLKYLEKKFSEAVIVKITKRLETEDLKRQMELLKAMKDQKLSPEEHGFQMLGRVMERLGCKVKIEEIFDPLVSGDIDLVLKTLTEKEGVKKI